jgi:hypothetical protein
MRASILLLFLATGGCKSGTLESGEWGKLRYFGELVGIAPLLDTDDDLQLPLVLIPPVSDRDGNVYVLHQRTTNDAAVYVGQALGGWSRGCPPGEEPLPNAVDGDAYVHGFLGTAETTAWFWAGDALVQVSGETGECKQVLDKDPLTLTDLRVMAALPYIHETPARRTLNAWVQGANDAESRLPPTQVVVDLDLRRYVTYTPFEPADATCVDVLGVGGNPTESEGIVVLAYNLDGVRIAEARTLNPQGVTTRRIPLEIGSTEPFMCEDRSPEDTPEPKILGQIQASDAGVYAGLLSNGQLLSFYAGGGSAKDLPNFDVQGMVKDEGALWVTGTADDRPVAGEVTGSGEVSSVIRWTSSEKAAANLQGTVEILDERYSPAEPVGWSSPTTAIGTWPFMTPHPLDTYAIETTGWLVAGPSFESIQVRTALAFGPVGMTVP